MRFIHVISARGFHEERIKITSTHHYFTKLTRYSGSVKSSSQVTMKSVLVSALLISVIAAASALDCYQCQGSGCGDPFDTSGNATCSSTAILPYTYCQKIVTGGDTVTRACNIVCIEGCVGSVCTSCCSTDLCNGGNTVTTSFVAMGVALVAAFIFSRQ